MADKPLIPFRVHFAGGQTVDVDATDPNSARDQAMKVHKGAIVTKIKRRREEIPATGRKPDRASGGQPAPSGASGEAATA